MGRRRQALRSKIGLGAYGRDLQQQVVEPWCPGVSYVGNRGV
jgi:hypothetical protein